MRDIYNVQQIRQRIKNCLTVFQHDPLLSGAIAYNLLTDRTDIVKPIDYDRSPSASMTDTDMKYIGCIWKRITT